MNFNDPIVASGGRSYQSALDDALDLYARAQKAKRLADNDVEIYRGKLADAVAEAEWRAGAHFTSEGNRTYYEGGEERRQVTADEKAKLIASVVRSGPLVAPVARQLREAEIKRDAAVDTLALAERRIQALRHQLDNATAELRYQTAVLEATRARTDNQEASAA